MEGAWKPPGSLDQGFPHPSRYRLDLRRESLGLQCDRAVTKKRVYRITYCGDRVEPGKEEF